MGYTISTSGSVPSVALSDIQDGSGGPLTFVHPVVDYDPLTNYDQEDLRNSADLQAAIVAGELILELNNTAISSLDDVGVASIAVAGGGGGGGGPIISAIEMQIDAGSYTIEVGAKGVVVMPYDCTITSATLYADVPTTSTITVRASDFASYPTQTDIDGVSSPTLTAADKMTDSVLAGWTTTLSEGDVVEFEVTANDLAKRLVLSLRVTQ